MELISESVVPPSLSCWLRLVARFSIYYLSLFGLSDPIEFSKPLRRALVSGKRRVWRPSQQWKRQQGGWPFATPLDNCQLRSCQQSSLSFEYVNAGLCEIQLGVESTLKVPRRDRFPE